MAGAGARYANCGDDENSQAEGLFDVASANVARSDNNNNNSAQNTLRLAANNQNHHHQQQQQQNLARNPHYENIYESIEQFATVNNAPVPAENPLPQAQLPNGAAAAAATAPVNQNSGGRRINLRSRNHLHYNNNSHHAAFSHPRSATLAYDIPRTARGNYYAANALGTVNRRATLETNMNNRVRYANANRMAAASAAALRQRSFDDAESYHCSHNSNNNNNNTNGNNTFRYENIYEQIREEPIYRNVGLGGDTAANRLYGRLDVIGHGIGRIERHLSSSCGNIDHYNLGGTYAILGHSHLSTVGHVYASNNAKETAGKSLNFFSCLGRENSQSMSNICAESSSTQEAGAESASAQLPLPSSSTLTVPTTSAVATTSTASAVPSIEIQKPTGAIPKIKSKVQNSMRAAAAAVATATATTTTTATTNSYPSHTSALNRMNRISKSSLQYLLLHKWIPLWIGNGGADCNVLDFNFMFSHSGCESDSDNVLMYNESNDGRDAASYANYRDFGEENYYHSSPRSRCYHNSLMRYNDPNLYRSCGSNGRQWPASYQRNEIDYNSMSYNANELPYNYCASPPPQPENPFRQWELNSENNSFRPASVIRRITDGTFPNGGQQQPTQPSATSNRNNNNNNNHNNPNNAAAAAAQEVRVEINNQPLVDDGASTSNSTPSTSRAAIAGHNAVATKNTQAESSASSSRCQLRFDRHIFESGTLSSSTESASETEKVRSPERRYSENTEDDQYNNSIGNSSSTDVDGDDGDGDDDENDDTISELHTFDTTDNSERIN